MVFVAGPRQVGKTTLAQRILAADGPGVYLNWDNREDRAEIRRAQWPAGDALVILDELHKWRGWKGWIKGEFDRHRDRLRFLVTGSARLEVNRRGGDSLQGRYHHYRLHPFTLAELSGDATRALPKPGAPIPIDRGAPQSDLDALLKYGGFPEPLLAQSERTLRRWQKERLERFFREDVRDLENVRDLSALESLAELLPERIASPLSLNALREDLEVSHRSITAWVGILERLYHLFLVRPWTSPRVRGLKRMPKAYLWDPTLVPDRAARYENLVALHLLKLCHALQDREGYAADLWYLRDRHGREVDFLVTVDRKPWFAVEAKLSDTAVDRSLPYYGERLKLDQQYQVVFDARRDFEKDGVRVLPARQFLAALV